MADISAITASNGTTYNIKDRTARGLLPSSPIRIYTSLTGTAAKTSSPYYCARYDVTDSSVTEYTNGMMVSIRVPVAGNGSYGTALQINSLGYKPIVCNVDTMISTRYSVGAQIIAVYNSTQTGSLYINSASASTVTGCWQVCDYNTADGGAAASAYRLRDNYALPKINSSAFAKLYRYMIVLPMMDGTYVPVNGDSNKATTYTKVLNTTNAFNPFEAIQYYSSTTTVEKDRAIGAGTLYIDFGALDMRYSFNLNSSGTAGTTALTGNLPVYLKAKYNYTTHTAVLVPNSSSSNYLERSSLVQALPSSNPDTGLNSNETYIYILLGYAYSKYQIHLTVQKTVYHWDSANGCICVFDGNAPDKVIFVDSTSTFSAIYNAKQNGYIPVYKDADGFAYCMDNPDSSPTEITFTRINGSTIKTFTVDSTDVWTTATKGTGDVVKVNNSTTFSNVLSAYNSGKAMLYVDSNGNGASYSKCLSGHGISVYQSGFWNITLKAVTIPTESVTVVLTYSNNATQSITIAASEWGSDGTYYNSSLDYDPLEYSVTVAEQGATISLFYFTSVIDNTLKTYSLNSSNSWSETSTSLQEKLSSGVNIKRINNQSVLGSGNLSITSTHSVTYYAQNQSVSNGSTVFATPSYTAGNQYFADIKGYIYSTERTTRVYLQPNGRDMFYGETVDYDPDGQIYKRFAVSLSYVSLGTYTYRCLEIGSDSSFLNIMKSTSWSNSSHVLANFGTIT